MKALILVYTLLFAAVPAHALKFTQVQMISAGDMSSSITSPGVDLQDVPLASIQAVWTGAAPVGTLILQTSGDIVATQNLVTNWSDFSGSSVAVSGNGDVMYNLANAGYRWVRIKYTRTSGTGTINAILSAKGQY